MNNGNQASGTRKRQQIESAQKQTFMWVGLAAIALSLAVVLVINLSNVIAYQAKVNGKLGDTNAALDDSLANLGRAKAKGDGSGCPTGAQKGTLIGNLAKACNDPVWSKQNLVALTDTNGNPITHTPFQVIYDALPTDNDSAELGAAVVNVLAPSGVSVQSLSQGGDGSSSSSSSSSTPAPTSGAGGAGGTGGTTGSTTGASAGKSASAIVSPTPTAVPFAITIQGTYTQLQQALISLQDSIRPIAVNSVQISSASSDGQLSLTINISVYYVDKSSYKLGTEEVKP